MSYIDANGDTQTCTSYTVLTGNETTALGAADQKTWYVVPAGATINYTGTVHYNGDVNLILCDGAAMNIGTSDSRINGKGIDYNIDGSNHALTIYGQTSNNGVLSVFTTGGGIVTNPLTINGGTVIVDTSGGSSSALYSNGDITINGGSITARATGNQANAIYVAGSQGSFSFNGGNVTTSTTSGNAIYVSHAIYHFNWRNPGDQIVIASGGLKVNYQTHTVDVEDGKMFTDGNGAIYSGTLTDEQISSLAGKTLVPAYKVTFNANEGSFADNATTHIVGVPRATGAVTAAAPIRSNYHFAGWCTESDGTTEFDFANTKINADTEFFAKWSTEHDFTYSAAGDTITGACSDDCPQNYYNSPATLTIKAPTRTTYGGSGSPAARLEGADAFETATGIALSDGGIAYSGTCSDGTTYDSSTPPTAAGSYTASITVEGTTASVTYAIVPKTVTVSGVTATDRAYEQGNMTVALSDGTLDGVISGDDVTVDLSGATGTMADDKAGPNKDVTVAGVALGGASAANYVLSAQPTGVKVTIPKAPSPVDITAAASVTRGGNTVNLARLVATNGATGAVTYSISGDDLSCTLSSDGTLTSGDATGTVTVTVSVAEDDNYEAMAERTITVTVTEKLAPNVTAPRARSGLVADGSDQALVTAGSTSSGTMLYALATGGSEPDPSAYSSAIPTGREAGTYRVWYKVTGNDTTYDYGVPSYVDVTIAEAKQDESPTRSSGGSGSRGRATSGRWSRVAGENRYQTMARVSAASFDTSPWAVVASGSDFPDALAASSLAGAMGCPVVLTAPGQLSGDASAELARLGVSHVLVVGGEASVSSDAMASLASMGIECSRVAGADRVGTSLAVLQRIPQMGSASDTVVVATGATFADALSVGPWAYLRHAPIVLVSGGVLSDEALAAIRDGGFTQAVILGGTSSVSAEVESQLEGLKVTRLSGADRYETSSVVASFAAANGLSFKNPVVASGVTFPDALAGSPLAARRGGVLLLVSDGSTAAEKLLAANKSAFSSGTVLGGTASVSDSLMNRLEAAVR